MGALGIIFIIAGIVLFMVGRRSSNPETANPYQYRAGCGAIAALGSTVLFLVGVVLLLVRGCGHH